MSGTKRGRIASFHTASAQSRRPSLYLMQPRGFPRPVIDASCSILTVSLSFSGLISPSGYNSQSFTVGQKVGER